MRETKIEALCELVRHALAFSNAAAGEGLSIEGVVDPEDFLFEFGDPDEDWSTLPDRIATLIRNQSVMPSATPPAAEPTDAQVEAGWLLERADSDPAEPWYWAAGQIDPSRSSAWTQNHMAAIRFARKEDADAVATRLMAKVPLEVRVCNHEWVTANGQ